MVLRIIWKVITEGGTQALKQSNFKFSIYMVVAFAFEFFLNLEYKLILNTFFNGMLQTNTKNIYR